ncbi:MAG: hypothetical protein KDD73_01020 [Anaerolineales bacterium]|nr:hypothetical protein [Anaerolineales bacterium]
MSDIDLKQNGHHPVQPRDAKSVERLVRRQLEALGKQVWGTRMGLWAKYEVNGYLFPQGGYWWVMGQGENGRRYLWDVVYEQPRNRFVVGHARGNVSTESLGAEALEHALFRALEIGPIERVGDSGYVG